MDVSDLVRKLVREVLLEMDGQKNSARPCVMVLCSRDEHPAALVQEKLDEEADLIFCGEELKGQNPCRYILPFLSCSHMAGLAQGQTGGQTGSRAENRQDEVLKLLLQGKEVEVLEFEYKRYAQTAPGPLLRLYEAHEKTLASFGLKAFQARRPEAIRFRDELVTAKAVEQAGAEGASILAVPVTAKVTPLAADLARNLKIAIEKRL